MNGERYLEVAAAILDGTPIEWEALDRAAEDGDRGLVARLRALARISDVHRRALAETPAAWGPFRITERIGSGTFGDVYRARDAALDRDVALKLLRAPVSGGGSRPSTEGRLLARVRHANVVTVHGAADHGGVYGIWMEFVDGRTLADVVAADGPFAPRDVVAIGRDVCRALEAVHGSGLLHGDIKAQNVMRAADGRIVVMDFGTGRVAGDASQSARIAGTPLYVAPEVLDGGAPDASSDVYSLGVLLYLLLTGAFPVAGRTLREIRRAHADGARVAVRDRRAAVPRRIADVVDRAVAPKAERFQTAADLERALAAAAQPAIRRHWRAAAAVAALAGLGFAAEWAIGRRVPPERLQVAMADDGTVTAAAPDGRVLWRHAFDPAVRYSPAAFTGKPARSLGGSYPSVVAAVDIGLRRRDESAVDGMLVDLDPATGRERRRFAFDDKVVINGVAYDGPWSLTAFAVEERGGSRRIAVCGHHFHWDASIVVILDESLRRQGTYVQAGWLEGVHWVSPSRLIASGFNNAHDGGSVVLLDADHLDGQAPEPRESKYYCRNCAAGTPLRVVVMPRSELNQATVSRFNRVSFQALSDRLAASTIEIPGTEYAEPIAAIYEFTPSLDLVRASFAERYWRLHDALFAQGTVAHASRDCPERNGPLAILVWDRNRPEWTRVPIARAE